VLVREVAKALKDGSKDSNHLRLEALGCLQLLLSTHAPPTFQPHVGALLPPVIRQVGERYYKLTAEALRVCCELVRVLRPEPPAASFDFKPHVGALFGCAREQLTKQDQEHEVKECAIRCMGLVICHLGDACAAEVPDVLRLLLERMGNEFTRVTTVKTFAALTSARIELPLAGLLPAVVHELRSFLRKSNRPLRRESLATLATIMGRHAGSLGEADITGVLDELPPLARAPAWRPPPPQHGAWRPPGEPSSTTPR
jgi:cullin-associated NEDD8-dissociated protein 1